MISRISGKIIQKNENSVLLEVNGLGYEIFIPRGIMESLEPEKESMEFVTFHYYQTDPAKSIPVLIGFLNEIEKEFFEKFITVSGIGPKAAIKAMAEPISQIAKAIDQGDVNFLKGLPGIGPQRAKEIIAKLQGKVGKFALIQDKTAYKLPTFVSKQDIEQEAVAILLQLQYKQKEAEQMVRKALQRNQKVQNAEELLNEVYRQKFKQG